MNDAHRVVNASRTTFNDIRLPTPGIASPEAQYCRSEAPTPLRVRLLGGFRVERIDQFEKLADDALRGREIAAYKVAFAVYGGELPEDRYESWCSERRSALAELHIRLLLGMAEALEGRGSSRACSTGAQRLRR